MLNVAFIYYCAECRYTKRRCAECRGAQPPYPTPLFASTRERSIKGFFFFLLKK
jgi:hypothetical protein